MSLKSLIFGFVIPLLAAVLIITVIGFSAEGVIAGIAAFVMLVLLLLTWLRNCEIRDALTRTFEP